MEILDLQESLNRNTVPHGSWKPILVDSINYYPDLSKKSSKNKVINSLFFNHYLQYQDSNGLKIYVDPIINVQGGYDKADQLNQDTLFYTNTRGIKIAGGIGAKFAFSSVIYENQSRFVNYQDQYVRSTGASIGLGRTKKFKNFGHDYSMTTGMVVYKPLPNAEIWFGHGKNVVGVGYRSLLLSDHGMNYPHVRLAYRFMQGKLQYQSVFASLSTGYRYSSFSTSEPSFINKGASFHYLSYQPSSKWEFGLFESTIWRRYNNQTQEALSVFQFNPVFGLNAVGGFNSAKRNGMFGFQAAHSTATNWRFYSQYMIDGKQKQGFQLGASKQDLILKGLFVRAEFNQVSKGAYSTTDSLMAYTQFRQSLAHPMGSGFREFTTTSSYRYKRFLLDLQATFAQFLPNNVSPGLYLSGTDFDPSTFNVAYTCYQPSLSYIVHPPSNMKVAVGAILRNTSSVNKTLVTNYVFVSLCTNLNNLNIDF